MLESVKAQQGVRFEHLVFDAGSTDGTLDIIREYDHVQLTVEADKGMSDAINKGFRAARGKWVMWLNTDDRLKPGALKAMLEFAEKHPTADVIYGGWDFIDAEGQFMRRMGVHPLKLRTLAHSHCYIGSTSTYLRKSSVIDRGYLLNEKFRYVMDSEYYLRLAAAGLNFVYFKKVLADFRLHGENLSFRHQDKREMNEVLARELQQAETRAVRRVYGITIFKHPDLNSFADYLLGWWFKLWRQPARIMGKWNLDE